MRIAFVWRRLTPPAFIGGAEISAGLWAALLASLGHDVEFIGSAESPRGGGPSEKAWLLAVLGSDHIAFSESRAAMEYNWRGVRCMCVSQARILEEAERVVAGGVKLVWTAQEGCDEIAKQCRSIAIASIVHSVSETGLLSTRLGARFLFAPSRFTQSVVHKLGHRATLARSIVEVCPSTPGSRGRNLVMFVNPIAEKGLRVATAVARALPDWEFAFIESWKHTEPHVVRELPTNVTVMPRQRSLDPLYARARLLLVPSTIDDAAPRVITEAGLHGVPVLGSTMGGIPELVVDSNLNCMTPNDLTAWIHRTNTLLCDAAAWDDCSRRQAAHSALMRQNPVDTLTKVGLYGDSGEEL